MKTKIIFLFVALFATISSLIAQESSTITSKTRFSLEIDPATFVFKGYSAHLRIQPKSSDHLLLGAGIYAMDMPDLFVDFNKNNKDMEWDVRINTGLGLFTEYHFSEVNRKFFIGGQLSAQQFKIEKKDVDGSEKFTNALLMGYGGYTLQPFNFPLYFKAWGGVGYTGKISGSNVLNDQEYDISPISVFATLHIGYTF